MTVTFGEGVMMGIALGVFLGACIVLGFVALLVMLMSKLGGGQQNLGDGQVFARLEPVSGIPIQRRGMPTAAGRGAPPHPQGHEIPGEGGGR